MQQDSKELSKYYQHRCKNCYILMDGVKCHACGTEAKQFFIEDGVLVYYTKPEAVTAVVVPEGVTHIDLYVFSFCENIKSVALPQGLILINCAAFVECKNLERISIPGTLKVIGDRAFKGCEKLKDIYFAGSREDWNKIDIENSGIPKTTKIYYNSK